MEISKDLIELIKKADSVDDLIELAKKKGIELAKDQAEKLFKQYCKSEELGSMLGKAAGALFGKE